MSYRPFRYQNWLKVKEIYSTGLYSTPQSCTATCSHPQSGQSSIRVPHYSNGSPLCLGKAASKSRLLKILIMGSFMQLCFLYGNIKSAIMDSKTCFPRPSHKCHKDCNLCKKFHNCITYDPLLPLCHSTITLYIIQIS